jgi:NitT/TauT family transport system permease protein
MTAATTDTAPATGLGRETRGSINWGRVRNHLILFLTLMVLWEIASRTGLADPLLYPRPTEIVEAVIRVYVVQATIWDHLSITMTNVLAGFFLGSAFGMGLAMAAGLSEVLRRYLKPYVILLEATPRIAMAPLIIAWLGFGFQSTLVIIMLVCFFAPFVNTLTGLLNADEDRIEMMRSLRATRAQILWKVMLPGAMPLVMAGLRLAMASALAGALVAEFISANEGMGVILKTYTQTLNMSSAFAALLTLTAVGFVLYRTMEIVEARVIFWQNDAGLKRVSRRRAAKWGRP